MQTKKTLPGDRSHEEEIARMIRVNHAGEYGAQRIYAGQLAVLGKSECGDTLRHMADQEQAHLDRFSQMINERKVRPTLLMPLWHVGGYAMGALTAMLGKEAAMACTEAVEAVIDEHYATQEKTLPDEENELKKVVQQFRAEEQEHHDIAVEEGARKAPFYQLLHGAITAQTKLAIWLSTRI